MAAKSPKRSADSLRALAVKEARRLITDGGADQFQVRRLAQGMGVSVGTIYNLFDQFDELLFHVNASVYDDLLAQITADLAAATHRGAGTIDMMLQLSRTYLNFVADHQALWSSVLAFNRMGKSQVPEWYRDKEREVLGAVAQTIAPLKADMDPDQLALAAATLWAAVHGIVSVSVGRNGLLATEGDVWMQIELVVTAVAEKLGA